MKNAILFLVTTSLVASAQTTVITPVQAVNLEPAEIEALGVIVAQQYALASGQKTIEPRDLAAAMTDTGVIEAARSLGASELIETSVVGLDGRPEKTMLLTLSRRNLEGQLLFQASMKAASLDDAITVAGRLAVAVWTKSEVSAGRSHHNVAAVESKPARRVKAEAILGVRTAMIQPVGPVDYASAGALGFDGRLERDSYFYELGVGLFVPVPVPGSTTASYGGLYGELGASYFLTGGNVGVYAGGGVLTRVILSNVSGFNLAPYAQLGVMLNRDSSTRLYADIRVAQNVLPVAVSSSGVMSSTRATYPGELSVQVGIGF